MGHDITALRPGVNEKELQEQHDLDSYDDGWSWRYDVYRKKVEIAYNRRSAGNPLNQVLYLALGVMEVYSGCSGDGSTLTISLPQLKTAKQILESGKQFRKMSRERNMSDDLVDLFRSAGVEVVTPGNQDGDISQEKQFVDDCIDYLEKTDQSNIEICFG